MATIATRIKQALDLKGLKQTDLVKSTGINKSSISTYISGEYEPKRQNIYKIANALNVSESWLMGHDVPMERDSGKLPKNIRPLEKVHYVPKIGRIACGTPIYAEENIEGKILLPEGVNANFALDCVGDSMIEADILDGDVVFIREQPQVENGEIAAVLIGEEATLKKVYYERDKLTLMPANSNLRPFVYVKEEMNEVRILGKAKAVLRILE